MNTPKTKKYSQWQALRALTKAGIISSLRNPSSLFFNFFFPFIFIVIFGIIGQSSQSFSIDLRPASIRQGPVYDAISSITVFNIATDKTDAQINDELSKGQVPVAITISQEPDFSPTPGVKLPKYKLDVETSSADPQNALTITSILDKITLEFNTPQGANTYKMLDVNQTTVQGRKFEQIDFILPGQLAFALLTNALFGVSFSLLVLRKELVIKRMFVTPVKKSVLLLSEAGSRIIIGILQALIIILVGHFVFNFTLANGLVTLLSLLVLSTIGITIFISFGLFVASVAKSEDSVSPLSNIIMMPQLFLSGAFFSIDLFPKFLQPIAHVLPMTFLNEAFKKVAFEGAPLSDTFPQILGLLVWGVIVYLAVVRLFKWEL